MKAIWRRMTWRDLPSVNELADRIHTDYPESDSVFYNRFAVFSRGCWVAETEDAGGKKIIGYAIAHPAELGEIPQLNSKIDVESVRRENLECLYIHDLALLGGYQRKGLVPVILKHLIDLAHEYGLEGLAGTAIPGTLNYWHRIGFEHLDSPEFSRLLACYGEGSAYMVRYIGDPS
jgi:hypothetical protein